jgi:DNA-binding protein H-NS
VVTYKELDARIRELQKEAAEQRRIETAQVIRQIRQTMRQHSLTIQDLGLRAALRGERVADKYRDPATGHHWSGRGSMPRWLREHIALGRSIHEFLIR